jgi:hypothetical protein
MLTKFTPFFIILALINVNGQTTSTVRWKNTTTFPKMNTRGPLIHILTPKDLDVFLAKKASNQPILKSR